MLSELVRAVLCTTVVHNSCAQQVFLHTFNSPFPVTTRVSWYQKGKTNLDFTEARESEWQCHQLGHMQVCTSLQTGNYAITPPLSFYWPDALPAAQPTAYRFTQQYAHKYEQFLNFICS